jgi:hypothetical protein
MRVVDRRVFERIRSASPGSTARPLPRLLHRLDLIVGRYGVGHHCLARTARPAVAAGISAMPCSLPTATWSERTARRRSRPCAVS